MNITIPDEILRSAEMSVEELKLEIAILLYQQKKISMGQAHHLAGMHLLEFQRTLASREICINYDIEDFEADLKNLREWGDL
jgi:predicted HTH domain antitoxin